jgi:hypothetical protein
MNLTGGFKDAQSTCDITYGSSAQSRDVGCRSATK